MILGWRRGNDHEKWLSDVFIETFIFMPILLREKNFSAL
jgi:hypothetical protein